MKTPKQLIAICISLIMFTHYGCTKSDAEKEIISLKAEIAQLKEKKSSVSDPITQNREEIIEHYSTGEKKW